MSEARRPGAAYRQPMTGGSDPGADNAHPTLAQEAGTAISAAVLRLAYRVSTSRAGVGLSRIARERAWDRERTAEIRREVPILADRDVR